jgi:hypothetical protein
MPAKKHRGFRFSEAADQALTTYSQKWSCTPTEALEKLLLRWRYLDDVGFTEFQETLSDEIACTLRFRHKGLFYCMYGVPRNVKLDRRLIETLDVCRVCRQRSLGLTEKSIMRSGAETESSPRLNMVHSPKAPFSYAPDRTRSSDPLERPSVPRPQGFHCALGKNQTYCYNNLCDQRGTCETQVER